MTKTNGLSFTEEMRGFVDSVDINKSQSLRFDKEFFNEARSQGEKVQQSLAFRLNIDIKDVDEFIRDPQHEALATGHIFYPELGGDLEVLEGTFNLFTRKHTSPDFDTVKEMHYTLFFKDKEGRPFTFYGYKEIEKEDLTDMWDETTTLYTYIWEGHHHFKERDLELHSLGILNLTVNDFINQLKTFTFSGADTSKSASTLFKFISFFSGNLWEAYAPFIFGKDNKRWNHHIFPIQTTEGVNDCEKSLIPFDTEDGLSLTLQRFKRKETKNIILLVHGLTTSTDMFIMPEHYNLTSYLLDNGHTDIWSLDWRGSGRFKYNLEPHRYDVDDIAAYDMPRAIEVIKEHVGEDVNIHVICHCVGSIGMMTSLSAGFLSNIKSVISNSVSFTPKVGLMAKIKLFFAPDIMEHLFGYPYLSPKIPYFPGPGFGKWIYWMEKLLRKECKEPACHMVSFMWGWGFPAAYLHKNLNPITHRRLYDLFGGTAVHYFRHLRKMIFNKEAIPYKRETHEKDLPLSYLQNTSKVKLPPTLLISGDKNLIFPESNKESFSRLQKISIQKDIEYKEFKDYGHQDVFMGKNSAKDIFPTLLEFINKHNEE